MNDVEREAQRYAEEVMGYRGISFVGTETLSYNERVVIFDVGGSALGIGMKGCQAVDEFGPDVLEERGWI